MCHCLTAAVATRDFTDSLSRQSSSSAFGVSIINPRHCLRNAGESHEIRESSMASLKQWHEGSEFPGHFTPGDGAERLIQRLVDVLIHEPDRTVAEQKVRTTGMHTVEIPDTVIGTVATRSGAAIH